ncbi:MAG: hypothetical protein JRF07_04815, partial [Deltaproteobacteria bacterium]|nr:hypothetical protein [Deltaproteobacteria bacterium]
AKDGFRERWTPAVGCSQARHAGCEETVARELRGSAKGQTFCLAEALEIAPHVATLGGKEVERRVLPAGGQLPDRPSGKD